MLNELEEKDTTVNASTKKYSLKEVSRILPMNDMIWLILKKL